MDSNLAMIERGNSGSARRDLLPARFCLHRDSPALIGHTDQLTSDHIDLFVLPAEEAERLWTFELPREFADTLSALPDAVRSSGVTVILKPGFADSGGSAGDWEKAAVRSVRLQTEWPAVRKADHRQLYWSYTGVIGPVAASDAGQTANQNRGTLSELCRGWLDWRESGPPPAGLPLLLRLSEPPGEVEAPFSQ